MNRPLYLPFPEGPWQMRMGLKPLALQDWIEIDDQFICYLQRKQELLQTYPSEVVASLPGSEMAQTEVLELLLDHLLTCFPSHYQRQGNQLHVLPTQQIWELSAFTATPIDLAGRLVQEDLCLLQPDPAGYRLVAASVCFPAHWRLRDKLGQPLTQIHQPVPGYDTRLAPTVDRLFDRLQVEHPGYRLNWGLAHTPELFLHPLHTHPVQEALSPQTVGEKLWIRSERQTLRRLPQSHHVLFTIRTYLYPLSLLEQHPTIAHNLCQILQHMPQAMQHYKQIEPIQAILLEYLGQIGNQTR